MTELRNTLRTQHARLRLGVDVLRRRIERTILWRVWERMLENEVVDRSVALAAKAFVSLFPSIIIVAAFVPDSTRASIVSTLTTRIGVTGPGLSTVKGAFASSDEVRRATGILGLVFTFFYINSFTTALGRVYVRAWRRPAGGRASGYAIGSAWLIGLAAYFALLGVLRAILNGGPETLMFALLAWLAAILMWWVTPWLMLQRQVRLRVLLTGAFITGTGMVVYAATANLWMPHTVTENQQQFGFFGVALSLVTWLTGAAFIIVTGACAAPVLAEDTGWIGQLVRGSGAQSVLADDAKPSLAAPSHAPSLSDALGIHRADDEATIQVP